VTPADIATRGDVAEVLRRLDVLDKRLDALAARPEEPVLLSTRDAAKLVGRSPAALRVAAGRPGLRGDALRAARVGEDRDTRWRREELLRAYGVEK